MDDSIPWKKLTPILICRVSEGIIWSHVFPFLPTMLASFDLAPHDIAFYAGAAESIMMAVEGLLAIPIAHAADKYGRKTVLLICVCWVSFAAAGMGTSGAAWHTIVWRLIVGFNGMAFVTRTMVSEITHPGNLAKTFAVFSPTYSIGITMGSGMGGYFALPEGRIPILGDIALFQSKPFLLPALMAAAVPCIALPMVCYWLPETLPSRQIQNVEQKGRTGRVTVKDVIRQPGIALLLFAFLIYQIVEFAAMGVFTLAATTSVNDGGMGLSVSTTGLILTCQAIFYALVTPVVAPYVVKRFGPQKAVVAVMFLWPIVILHLPMNIWLAGQGSRLLPAGISMMVMVKAMASICWPLFDMLVPGLTRPEYLVLTNAIIMITGAIGRTVGPSAAGGLYGLSTLAAPDTWGRQSVWFILLTASLAAIFAASTLRPPQKMLGDVEMDEAREGLLHAEGNR